MGIKLAALEEDSAIILNISSNGKSLNMNGYIKKVLRDNMAVIGLEMETEQKLNFDNVHIDVEYYGDEDLPIKWDGARIVYYQNEYIIQVEGEGRRHNRRECFRVGVSMKAKMRMVGKGTKDVIVRDISLSGFSLADRRKELQLKQGDELSIKFEDLGHNLDLAGRVVRIQEDEDMDVYGLEITNLCKDLSSYVSTKQRKNRGK